MSGKSANRMRTLTKYSIAEITVLDSAPSTADLPDRIATLVDKVESSPCIPAKLIRCSGNESSLISGCFEGQSNDVTK